MDPIHEQEPKQMFFNPVTFVLQFLATYGWYLLGGGVVSLYMWHKLQPKLDQWRQAREDAEYHKDPDKAMARMEAIQRARERQQQLLEEASQRAIQQQKERDDRKRQEAAEKLKKYQLEGGGQRLGSEPDGYLPLSGGASTSSYRPPKRSACSRGGCS